MTKRRETKKYYEKLLGTRFDKEGKIILDIDDLNQLEWDGYTHHYTTMIPLHQKLTKKIVNNIEKELTRLKQYFGTGGKE